MISKKLSNKLTMFFILISLIPFGIISVTTYFFSISNIKKNIFSQLTSIREIKKKEIANYFNERFKNIDVISETDDVVFSFERLNSFYKQKNIDDNLDLEILKNESYLKQKDYKKIYDEINSKVSKYAIKYGYYDIFLISKKGHVLYTFAKEKDFGTNLKTGKYRQSNLAKIWNDSLTMDEIILSDISLYAPSDYNPAMFIGKTVKNKKGNSIGTIVTQISLEQINSFMQQREGMGESGETYLVGNDYLMRSDSYLDRKNRTIFKSFNKYYNLKVENTSNSDDSDNGSVETKASINALKGKDGTEIIDDYRGEKVLSSYDLINLTNYKSNKLNDIKWAIIAEMDKNEAFFQINILTTIMIIVFVITLFVVIFISLLLSKSIVNPIKKLSDLAKKIEIGELTEEVINVENNEIGELVNSFNSVISTFKETSDICKKISLGDLNVDIKIKSEMDVLGKSIFQMKENMKEIIDQANILSNGNYEVNIEPRSKGDQLSFALINMVDKLKQFTFENNKQNFIKTKQSELNDLTRGDIKISELTKKILVFLVKVIQANVGTFYVNNKDSFELTSTYSFTKRKRIIDKVKLGENLIGQAALEKEVIIISEVPKGYIDIESSLGNENPFELLIIPCVFNGKVECIIEIGSFIKIDKTHLELIELIRENIAIAVNSSKVSFEMKELLEKTLNQSEELQTQQEELRQSNEELEEQTKILKLSEEKLQAQQEELRQSNEELEAQSNILKESEQRLQSQQEELRVTNEELEEKTQELEKQKMDIELKNKNLKIAQEELQNKSNIIEKASTYKSEFLANMSHELRNPLNSILILSQILMSEDKVKEDKSKEYAKTINTSGKDLLNLINDILDLSKIEAGKMEVNIDEIDLKSFSENLRRSFLPITNEKGLDFRVNIEKEVEIVVLSDEQKLSQIVRNLLSNAIKFTKKGYVELNIIDAKNSKKQDNYNSDYFALIVKDSGIGISTDKVHHIFEAFKQADGRTSRQFGGTGLGLSITKELSLILGGDVFVESEINKGSEFTVFIKKNLSNLEKFNEEIDIVEIKKELDKKTEKETIKTDKNEIEPEIEPEKQQIVIPKEKNNKINEELKANENKMILIVEDDDNFSKIVSEYAIVKGFKIHREINGKNAINFLKTYNPIAIILDIGLPDISGWEVIEKIKKIKGKENIPIHIMSGNENKKEISHEGVVEFYKKPISLEDLDNSFSKFKSIIKKDIKNVLMVEELGSNKNEIIKYIKTNDSRIEIDLEIDKKKILDNLKINKYDCMILDLDITSFDALDVLEQIRNEDISQIPVIIYTTDNLTFEENEKLSKYAETVIIKGPRSIERLFDETKLFIHNIEKKYADKEIRMLKSNFEKDEKLKSKKVLIVDDDVRNLFALAQILETKGMEVVMAKNGVECLEKLENNKEIDLVLMDIMMPEMDGYTAMRRIRKMKGYSNIPIIALTAKAMKNDREKAINSGANDYITKPVQIEKLISLIRVWLY